jgi:hypothetical protein
MPLTSHPTPTLMLLLMPTEPLPGSRKSLKPSIRSLFRKKSVYDGELRPKSSGGLMPKPTTSTTESDESRSTRSSSSRRNSSIKVPFLMRMRSSSNVNLSEGPKLQESDFKKIESWWLGFERYSQLVTLETSPNDAYHAGRFAAISGILTKNLDGRFIHGLPEAAMDFALLWCPAGPGSRKVDSEEPSWSWTGWQGSVNYPFDPSNCPDVRRLSRKDGDLFKSEITHFSVGTKDSQYCLRREAGAVLRTSYPSHFHAPWGSKPVADTNTLRFSAFTIDADCGLDIEQLNYGDQELPCSVLLAGPQNEKKTCGVLMEFEEALFGEHYGGTFEYVLLSRNVRHEASKQPATPMIPTYHPPNSSIWNGERFLWHEEIEDFDPEVYAKGPWKMLNIMLIKWHGDYAERVAVGRIHEDEWMKHSPKKKDIVLR